LGQEIALWEKMLADQNCWEETSGIKRDFLLNHPNRILAEDDYIKGGMVGDREFDQMLRVIKVGGFSLN